MKLDPTRPDRNKVVWPAALGKLLVLVSMCGWAVCAQGQTVVEDCTEDALLSALSSGDSLIIFTQNCAITLAAPILIESDLTIDAQGHTVTISATNSSRIFEVTSGNVTLLGLSIAGGTETNGGAIYINTNSTVLLSNCIFSANSAFGTDGLDGTNGVNSSDGNGGAGRRASAAQNGQGGAIYNMGDLTVLNSRFLTNSVGGGTGGNGGDGGSGAPGLWAGGKGGNGGAGGFAQGGAIFSMGTLSISNSTFAGNMSTGGDGGEGGSGGAGFAAALNGAGGGGGGAYGAAVYATGTVWVASCTFSDNTATGGTSATAGTSASSGNGNTGLPGGSSRGAALCLLGGGQVLNCTFYNDNARGGNGGQGGLGRGTLGKGGRGGKGGEAAGGGVFSLFRNGELLVTSCTFSNSSAFGGTNGPGGTGPFSGRNGSNGVKHGGALANGGGVLSLLGSLIATNASGGAAFGKITDAGYNIGFDSTLKYTSGTSFKIANGRLGPLADNGGPTLTMALLTNSPARDAIPSDTTGIPATDQRGIFRPQGLASDIGAFEFVNGPAILVQPQSVATNSGAVARFTVSAFGDSLHYQWFFNNSKITNATSLSLTLNNVSVTNVGSYFVQITNSLGVITSSVVTLSLASPVVITQQPTNQTAAQGSSATFTLSATGDAPLVYRWYFNMTNALTGASGSSLTINNVQPTNAGNYNASVSNVFGAVISSVATLSFILPAHITTEPTNQTVTEGANATFQVGVMGVPPPSFQWKYFGTNILGATNSSFTRVSVQTNQAGPYGVFISNGFSSEDSSTAQLTVLPAPVPVPNPPGIASATVVSNTFKLVYPTQSGFNYVLQIKDGLADLSWLPMVTNTGTGGLVTNVDGLTNSSRLYRIQAR